MSFIFGGFPTPEELQAAQAAADRNAMKVEDFRRGLSRLFDELDQDNLTTLAQLFHMLSGVPNEHMPQMVSYYEGMLTAKLQDRFNLCPNCGGNHDEVPDDMLHGGDDTSEDEVSSGEPVGEENLPRQPHPDSVAPPVEVVHELHPDDLAKMEEYNLEDVRDEDTLKLLYFRCKGCGLNYQSIEDRMLKEPGVKGCDGCQQKAKWG
jgi:hypothetical protein